jgi:hypothetical protein
MALVSSHVEERTRPWRPMLMLDQSLASSQIDLRGAGRVGSRGSSKSGKQWQRQRGFQRAVCVHIEVGSKDGRGGGE